MPVKILLHLEDSACRAGRRCRPSCLASTPLSSWWGAQGAELIDSVMDVVRKEAESCDCLQGRRPLPTA